MRSSRSMVRMLLALFTPETTIILDEAATASTPKLAALAQLADQKDWRVVMVGDPHPFSAVGRGGMFAHLVDIYGATELEQVHRFHHEWERQASLGLRHGDPRAIDAYEAQGRLHGGTSLEMESRIVGAWWAARQRDEEVVLMANRNETVDRLNQHAQLLRKRAGQLDPRKGRVRAGEQTLHVGDEVVTRMNDRRLRTDEGHMVKNRDHWTVTAINSDRSVTLSGQTGTIRLPADYVAEHVRLGYAQTSHSAQGRTVDTALLLVDGPTDQAGIYTPMTRGREANHAYIITEGNQTPVNVLTQAISRQWIDQPAITEQERLAAEQHADGHRRRQVDQDRRAKLASWERDPYSTTTRSSPDRGLSL